MTLQDFKKVTEEKVLKYLFINVSYIALGESKLQPDYFSTYYDVYQFIITYYHKFGGIYEEIAAEDFANSQGLNHVYKFVQQYLAGIRNIKIDESDSAFLAEINVLIGLYKKMAYIQLAQDIVTFDIPNAPIYKISQLEEQISKKMIALTTDKSLIRTSGSLAESAEIQLKLYNDLKDNPEQIEYIPTGMPIVDKFEGGFRKSELVYIIGRKGAGKSILMLNMGLAAANANKNVLLFSLEMSKEDYERRLAAAAASIPSNGLKRGTLDNDQYAQYVKYLRNLSQRRTVNGTPMGHFVIIDIPSQITPSFIESQLLFEQKKRNIKFDEVIVDYAGIMSPNIAVVEKRHAQGAIALDLKNLARKYNCVIISGAQMSRQGKNDINTKGGHADSAHIAESDQVADHIDWGIAIKLLSQDQNFGIIESFKTRDAAPFSYGFRKDYHMMQITPIVNNQQNTVDKKDYKAEFNNETRNISKEQIKNLQSDEWVSANKMNYKNAKLE